MKKIIGYYNELEYTVEIIGPGDHEVLYSAGNSPFDSQGYTSKEEGVGLEKMKQYCEQTAKEIAKEMNIEFIGIEYEENEK